MNQGGEQMEETGKGRGTEESDNVEVLGGPAVRLTDRDRHAMAHLAVTRLLSSEQLQRLIYPERSEKNLHKRLLMLSGIGKAGGQVKYLRRIQYRTYDGHVR